MKTIEPRRKHELSRRRFLEVAIVTAAAASTTEVNGEAETVDPERRRLGEILETYGSELGELRKVR